MVDFTESETEEGDEPEKSLAETESSASLAESESGALSAGPRFPRRAHPYHNYVQDTLFPGGMVPAGVVPYYVPGYYPAPLPAPVVWGW